MKKTTAFIETYKRQLIAVVVIVSVLLLLIGVTKCSSDEPVTAEEQAEEKAEEAAEE